MCVVDNHIVCEKASILVVEYNEQLLLLLLVECYKLLMFNAPKDLSVRHTCRFWWFISRHGKKLNNLKYIVSKEPHEFWH
jgi:hypothetical protein